ncbi:MAG: hypothetical protein Aureis2KO_08590 [Aureisphaera sp.]
MKSRLKKEYKTRFSELRTLINSWNLIPDSPTDEFDSINHLLLSQLYRESDTAKLRKILYFELTNNYGLSVTENELDDWLDGVLQWWPQTP